MEYYSSERIEEILKSDKAQEILGWFPPVYSDAYVFLWLLEEVGMSLSRLEQWAREFAEQVMPQTATWSLPYWEERYGILPDEKLSLSQRRNQIVNRRRTRAPMPPAKAIEIVENLTGVDVRIEENTGKNKFTVMFGDVVPQDVIAAVRRELNILKPAHLIYEIVTSIFYEMVTARYLAAKAGVFKMYEVKEEE